MRNGKKENPIKTTWFSMRQRCNNPNSKYFEYYGARGITICDRWSDFNAFAEDMGPRPPKTSIDRIDNNGNYEPGNCKWSTTKEQMRNRRNAVFVIIENASYRVMDLAAQTGMKADTIVERARKGMTLREVTAETVYKDTSGLALGGRVNGARQSSKTHCKYGHKFTPENTYTYPTKAGGTARSCRACRRKGEDYSDLL